MTDIHDSRAYDMMPPPAIGSQGQQAQGSSPVARVRTPTEVLADRRRREEQKRAQGGTSAAERLAEVTGAGGQHQQPSSRGQRAAQPLAEITNVGTSSRPPRQSGQTARQQGSGIPVPQSRKESTRPSRQNENAPPDSARPQAEMEKPQTQQQWQDTTNEGARNSNGTSNGNRNSGNNGAGENGSRRSSKPANTSTFPHAFERWETLSSHWEGLTSYWMKRLETNSSEFSNNPLNQQLSRQVTDLSAAGANLFHAVVELQRLRASSERKFQRWFLETRHEQERMNEREAAMANMLHAAQERVAILESERVDEENVRTSATTMLELERLRQERERHELEMKDMRRELNISREEARRGWEEIGRLEAQERERIEYLKQGVPVWHGQIQVVPVATTQGSDELAALQQAVLPGNIPRQTQNNPGEMSDPYDPMYRDDRQEEVLRPEDPRGTLPSQSQSQTQQSPRVGSSRGQTQTQPQFQGQAHAQGQMQGHSPQYAESEIETDPFVEDRRRDQSAMQPSLLPQHGQGYFSGSTSARTAARSAPSINPEDEEQAYYRQQHVSSPTYEGEEYGDNMDYMIDPQEQHAAEQSARIAMAQAQGQNQGVSSANDNLSAGTWALPRHQHPTRLSDVLEEDERSRRTSPSHASERSRGYR